MEAAGLQLRRSTRGEEIAVPITAPDPEPRREEPWHVTLHNDDYTPMEYVAKVLHEIFSLNWFRATFIMMRAHVSGQAEVGTFPAEEAERRVDAAHERARADGWPLRLTCGPASEP
jgi:ATP-dependent Clp protease adaptor protein ClpS